MSARVKAGELAIQRAEAEKAREKRSKERLQQLKMEALRGDISLDTKSQPSAAKSQPSAAKSPFNGVGHKLGTHVKKPIKINTASPLKKTREESLILEMVRIIQHPEEYSLAEVQVAKDCFIGIYRNDSENRTFLETCYEQVKHELDEVSTDAFQFAHATFEDDGFQVALKAIAKLEAREAIAKLEAREAIAKLEEDKALQAAIALSMQER